MKTNLSNWDNLDEDIAQLIFASFRSGTSLPRPSRVTIPTVSRRPRFQSAPDDNSDLRERLENSFHRGVDCEHELDDGEVL